EHIAAPVRDVLLPVEEAPVGGVFTSFERGRRAQHPQRQIVAAAAAGAPKALAGAEMRLPQHLRDFRSAVPLVPGRLPAGFGEVAADDVDRAHRITSAAAG